MGRLKLDLVVLLFALVLVKFVVQSQYYTIDPPKPIYFVERASSGELVHSGEQGEVPMGSQFMSRSGASKESVEEQEDDDEDSGSVEDDSPSERRVPPRGHAQPVRLPPNFDEKVNRLLPQGRRPKHPLHGDPSSIHQDDDEGRRPESRLLWPFSIEIKKGGDDKGGGGGWGPGHYGSYTSWATNGWGGGEGAQGHGWGGQGGGHPYNYGWGDEKGHDKDEEILKSKHYKKYLKKKKKIVKKLKKKLKFKRLIQKILQKHITYLDKIAPY